MYITLEVFQDSGSVVHIQECVCVCVCVCVCDEQAVLERDPHYVVRRFESGRYAVDSTIRQIYQQALEV